MCRAATFKITFRMCIRRSTKPLTIYRIVSRIMRPKYLNKGSRIQKVGRQFRSSLRSNFQYLGTASQVLRGVFVQIPQAGAETLHSTGLGMKLCISISHTWLYTQSTPLFPPRFKLLDLYLSFFIRSTIGCISICIRVIVWWRGFIVSSVLNCRIRWYLAYLVGLAWREESGVE